MPKISKIPGAQGYAKQAAALIPQYESIPFTAHHHTELHLLPTVPSRILDIGAGTGLDAAWFAERGHSVVAVEPTAEFLAAAKRLHPSPLIEWLDDALPDLDVLVGRAQCFDLVMLSAVWMHLDEAERRTAMPRVASLLAPGGVMVLSLRHGPVPAGRRMFAVSGRGDCCACPATRSRHRPEYAHRIIAAGQPRGGCHLDPARIQACGLAAKAVSAL